jgi:hypothetical protein
MADPNLHVLLEMTEETDCRFVAAWLTKAAQAQEYWSQCSDTGYRLLVLDPRL